MGTQIPETGGRLFWPGTNAAIPGRGVTWEEDAAFAGRYLQGDTTTYAAPANGGGVHTHGGTTHTHTGNAHDHTFTGSSITWSTVAAVYTGGVAASVSDDAHAHNTVITTPSTAIGYSTDAMAYAGSETHPEHITLIVIKVVAAAGDQDIPDDAVVLSNNTVLPAGFTKLAALNGKFLRAVAAGQDSNLAGAGSATHTHTHGAPGHSHTADGHVHAGIAAGPSDSLQDVTARGTPPVSTHLASHHPSVSMDNAAIGDTSAVIDVSDATSSEPAYIELLPLQNTSGGDLAPVAGSTIIPFVGAYGTIPVGWEFYAAGDSLQVKCTTTDGDVEGTGGANAHTHTSSHTHVHAAAHNHTATVSNSASDVLGGSDDVIAAPSHTHTWTVTTTMPTIAAATPTLDSQDGRAENRSVIWIRRANKRVTLGTIHKTLKVVLAA